MGILGIESESDSVSQDAVRFVVRQELRWVLEHAAVTLSRELYIAAALAGLTTGEMGRRAAVGPAHHMGGEPTPRPESEELARLLARGAVTIGNAAYEAASRSWPDDDFTGDRVDPSGTQRR